MFWINYLSKCQEKNMSPSSVAKELGITSGTVSGWKRGVIPSQKNLQKIADYFGVSVWELLGEQNNLDAKQDSDTVKTIKLREDLKDNYAFRILYDSTDGATESDMLEAAAVIQRRKEERGRN